MCCDLRKVLECSFITREVKKPKNKAKSLKPTEKNHQNLVPRRKNDITLAFFLCKEFGHYDFDCSISFEQIYINFTTTIREKITLFEWLISNIHAR